MMPAVRRTDAEAQAILSRYQEQYRDAPLGHWCSCLDPHLGIGFDGTGLFGSRVEFRPDGTGSFESWGLFSAQPATEFRWSKVGPYRVSILVVGEELEEGEGPDEVAYEFYMLEGSSAVFMAEDRRMGGEEWFWRFPGAFVRAGGLGA